MIQTIEGAIRLTAGKRHKAKLTKLSFDELSVLPHYRLRDGRKVDAYRLIDAVLYGALLCTVLAHADFVKINCQALVVNENGLFTALPTESPYPQTILYPFRDIAHFAKGCSLKLIYEGPVVETPHYGKVPYFYSACTWDHANDEGAIFMANLHLEEPLEINITLDGFPALRFVRHWSLHGDDPFAYNTEVQPQCVQPQAGELPMMFSNCWKIQLPPCSWHVLRFVSDLKQRSSGYES